MEYPWPGNVRELENAVERALILGRGEAITFENFRVSVSARVAAESEKTLQLNGYETMALDEVITLHIRKILEMTGGRIGGEKGAAKLPQINPSTLRKRMKKLGIPFGRKAKSLD